MTDQDSLLQVEHVSKFYDDLQVSRDVSFSLKKGEIGCLLGPSGCGKTTLLRIIAGFESINSGEVRIGGTVVSEPRNTVPPEKRSIGMVFQDYALFPHLTIHENVGFGLSALPGKERKKRIGDLLSLVRLDGLGKKYPHEISGGQQQRVALARALAPRPELLLLDEPFSNLDALLRDRLTVEVRDILKELGTTALLVTHNQHEAFAVADRIGVLFKGRMQQWDSGYNIYHAPESLEVATFVGDGTLVHGTVVDKSSVQTAMGVLKGTLYREFPAGSEVDILLRPEDVLHVEDAELQAKVVHKSFRGPTIKYDLELPSGEICQALVSSHHNHRIGEMIGILPEIDKLVAFRQGQEG